MRLAKWTWGELSVILFTCTLISAILIYYNLWFLVFIPAFCAVVGTFFFRDPERATPKEENIIVSPADGTVWDIEEIDEPDYIGGKCLRIGIFMSVFNVHVNRAPISGKVEYLDYRPGKFMAVMSEKAIRENERQSIGINFLYNNNSSKMLVNQISGVVARKIVCELKVGDQTEIGKRFGMIKFGSRLEIIVPVDLTLDIKVNLKDKVKAGETVLGVINEKKNQG